MENPKIELRGEQPRTTNQNINHMTKEEKVEFFNRNFDRQAYEKAKAEILAVIKQNESDGDQLFDTLNGFDIDYYYDDKCDKDGCPMLYGFDFFCTKELDRSRMETDADYVEVEFSVYWSVRQKKAWIEGTRLYVGYPNGDGSQVCSFHPDTCNIIEWLWD